LKACEDENRPVAKLTDFGLSRNVDWFMTSCVGNLFYLAPEVFSGDHYTQSAGDLPIFSSRSPPLVDVYSYGILIWELVARVSPYPNESPQVCLPSQLFALSALIASSRERPSSLQREDSVPHRGIAWTQGPHQSLLIFERNVGTVTLSKDRHSVRS
jgi:serine/threonine protein kinase